jgi:hypothetical protein
MINMRRPIRWAIFLIVVVAALWLGSRPATARADADTHCSLAQSFGAALRYLRVDLGFEVIEKDPEAAYVLFRYRVPGDPKREVPGAIEFVKLEKKVRIFVRIPQMPVLHEQLLRDGLVRKLAQDYGEIGRTPEKPKNTAPDAGSN